MSGNDWYDTDSWYEPREPAAAAGAVPAADAAGRKKKKPRKGLKNWHILLIALLAVALLVGSSLAFRGTGGAVPNIPDSGFGNFSDSLPEDDGGEMPEEFHDFFENFYEEVQSDVAEINIPRAKLPFNFQLELAPEPERELTLQELYERCANSIVAIAGYMEGRTGYNWGTGIVLSKDGLILTNTHVIDGCDSATVTLYDDRVLDAELVGADAISDVAILKIDAHGLPTAVFGESGSLAVGDHVAAIGNPLGEEFRCTMTDGIISAIERGVNYNGRSMTLLQTNTALNEGNSGGALFNMYGQVVGITNMKMMSTYSSIEGIGFAIPSSTVREVAQSLLRDGEVRGRPSIGITVGAIPENASEYYELPEGLYVSEVSEGSDAQAKGIRPGDIITHVNGNAVTTTEQVNQIKSELGVGDTMTFTIWREGEVLEISVVLMDTNDLYK